MNSIPTIDISPYQFNDKFLENPSIKITDFGFYCNNSEKFNSSFGTQYYQAPEMILEGDCNSKVDIWALGCMLYELVTGEILFDPPEPNMNINHLSMMINLGKKFTSDYLSKTKRKKLYFNKNGRLHDHAHNRVNSSIEDIKTKLNNKKIYDDNLIDLLQQMLTLDPNIRICITSVLKHKWL